MSVDFSDDHGDWLLQVVVTDPPWYENCYIVQHKATGAQAIIDPGSNADKIEAVVKANGGPVEAILLTHGHPDHLGALRPLQDRLGVSCRAHKDEDMLISHIVQYGKSRLGLTVPQPQPVDYFDSGAALTLGGQSFRAIFTPGHTPGGVCFDFGSFTVTGDTLFNQGLGRTDLPGGNGPLLVQSISGLLEQLPDDCYVYPGHGPRWTIGEAKPWWADMIG